MPKHASTLAALLVGAGLFAPRPAAADEAPLPSPGEVKAISIHPAKVSLNGSDDAAQLVVTATLADGRLQDLTHDVKYTVADGKTAVVNAAGRVVPKANGASEVVVDFGGKFG